MMVVIHAYGIVYSNIFDVNAQAYIEVMGVWTSWTLFNATIFQLRLAFQRRKDWDHGERHGSGEFVESLCSIRGLVHGHPGASLLLTLHMG